MDQGGNNENMGARHSMALPEMEMGGGGEERK